LQGKWDGPYIVHSVLSNGAETIMDVKGDQFMVNGQRLRFTMNPTLCPFTILMSSPWKKSPNVQPRTENKVLIFVNSFSFIFLEFLAQNFCSNFFSRARMRNRVVHRRRDRPGPVHPAQWGPGGGSPRFFPDSLLFNFFLW
jgi:hypothetical protein